MSSGSRGGGGGGDGNVRVFSGGKERRLGLGGFYASNRSGRQITKIQGNRSDPVFGLDGFSPLLIIFYKIIIIPVRFGLNQDDLINPIKI